MTSGLRSAYECGCAQAGRDVLPWAVIAVLAIVCAASATLGAILLPGPEGSGVELAESPVPAGVWAMEWSPSVATPEVEQHAQLRAWRYVAAGTAGLLSALCFLVVCALWGQRLRLRRDENFVHWAVGASRWQLFARLLGESRVWTAAILLGVATMVPVLVVVLERTFPGHADVGADAKAAAIVLAALVTALANWERRAAMGPVRHAQLLAYRIFGSPIAVGAVGVAILSAVGVLVLHAPSATATTGDRDGVVVSASLQGLPEEVRRERIASLTERVSAMGLQVGLASSGAVRGVGHSDGVLTECGRCFEGGIPMPLKLARAEVQAVASDTFAHLGLQVLRGRDFDERIDGGTPSVAIVSQSLAGRHFERGEALGRRVRVGDGGWLVVVGVVQDAPDERDHMGYAVYVPIVQAAPTEIELLAAGSGPPTPTLSDLVTGVGSVGAIRTRADVFMVHAWFRDLLAWLGVVAMLVLGAGLWVAAANEAGAAQFEIGVRRAVGGTMSMVWRAATGTLVRRIVVAAVGGTWLSLFLGAGLTAAYGAIPQVDSRAMAAAVAWMALAYLAGSLVRLARTSRASIMECLGAS